jgi:hypothetical protein
MGAGNHKRRSNAVPTPDLIEVEQIKTARRLKESIEEYKDKIVSQILALNPKKAQEKRKHIRKEPRYISRRSEAEDNQDRSCTGKMISPMLDVLQIRRSAESTLRN